MTRYRFEMKKKKKRIVQPSDLGPAERLEHDEIILEETMKAGIVRARVTTQTVLDRYRQRNQISAEQFDAGERFRVAWFIGCRGASVTANYDVRIPTTKTSVDDHTMNARRDVRGALDAVGKQLSPIVVHTCGMDLSAQSWASKHGHDGRSGLTVLKIALDGLVDHFGL